MITKGTILSTPFNNRDNTFLVQIDLFKTAGNLPEDSKLDASKQTATLCLSAGMDNNYAVGDIVYIAFEDNDLSKPVIIGKLFTNIDAKGELRKKESVGSANLQALTVSRTANLPLDTVFGNNADEVTANTILTQIREISNLKNITSNLPLIPQLATSTNPISANNKFTFDILDSFNLSTSGGVGVFTFGNCVTILNLYRLVSGVTYKTVGTFVYDLSGSVVTTTLNYKYTKKSSTNTLEIWSGNSSKQLVNGYTGYLFIVKLL